MREMNLLPEEHLYNLEQNKKRKNRIILILAIVFCIIVFYLSVYFIEYNTRKEVSNIKSKIESLEKVRNVQSEISANQEVLDNRQAMLEMVENKRVDHYVLFNELEKTLPNEITLRDLTHPSGNYFNIKGTTTKPDEIADFMVNIAKIEGVENVFLDNIDYGSGESQQENVPHFTIYFTYSVEEGGETNDSNQ
jgi:Tfp pilus assembly protein PilN